MTINTYISMIESKRKLSKQEEERQNHGYGEGFDGCQIGGVWGNGGRGEGIKRYKQVIGEQPWGYKVQYKKWSSERTYTHLPWT